MRSIWKGALTFGLVNVPVKVYSATEDHDVSLHQVHNKDGGRIRYQRICEIDGEVVPFQDIDKAYDDGDKTVVLTKDDLASLPAERSREIDVVEFVPSEQVDPLTFDRAYYLEPDSASPKAYVLLRKTLEQTDRTAIVRFSLRQKTRLAALRVRGDVLVLQTLLWADEVREAAFPSLGESVRISAKELELSASLVDSFSSEFDPAEFADEYQEELRTLIRAKLEQGDALDTAETFGEQEEAAGGEVIDLMEALRASVERSRAGRGDGASKKKATDAAPARQALGLAEAGIRDESRSESGSEEEGLEGLLTQGLGGAGGVVLGAALVAVLRAAVEDLRVEHEVARLFCVDDDVLARGRLLLRLRAFAQVVPHGDDRGAADGGEQDEVDVLGDQVADEGDEAEQVAEHGEAEAPQHRADEVVERVLALVHAADARGDRRERANDRARSGPR